jgi:hypothetical protein
VSAKVWTKKQKKKHDERATYGGRAIHFLQIYQLYIGLSANNSLVSAHRKDFQELNFLTMFAFLVFVFIAFLDSLQGAAAPVNSISMTVITEVRHHFMNMINYFCMNVGYQQSWKAD